MSVRKTVEIRSIVYAAVCLSLCLVLPLLTGFLLEVGTPPHLPCSLRTLATWVTVCLGGSLVWLVRDLPQWQGRLLASLGPCCSPPGTWAL